MNKEGLVKAVSEKSDLSLKDASRFLNGFMKVVSETLANGQEISLVGFGAFSKVERSARAGRDFKTGESINVPAYRVVKFKPGKGLKDAVI
ncbi:transcriptional regulator [Alphaproteobacteria bacterium]|nr:transcriptional regulator [Alphaproteobacteria bacterium]